jgi:hypothetical protein
MQRNLMMPTKVKSHQVQAPTLADKGKTHHTRNEPAPVKQEATIPTHLTEVPTATGLTTTIAIEEVTRSTPSLEAFQQNIATNRM